MFRTLLTRRPGADGTKKLLREYGARLVCVRYRYDEERHERIKTIELVVDRVPWNGRRKPLQPDVLSIRLREDEDLLRRALLLAHCPYDPESGTWRVPREIARSLGLLERAKRPRFRSKRHDPIPDRTTRR